MRGNERNSLPLCGPGMDRFLIPMRGNENVTVNVTGGNVQFLIPMRGNEFTGTGDGGLDLAGFLIPMRGNEMEEYALRTSGASDS